MDDVSAYQVAAANIDLAIDFAKSFAAKKSDTENSDVKLPKRTAILLPDEAEANIAIENLGGPNPYPGITVSSLIRSDKNDKRIIKPEQLVLNLFGRKNLGAVKPIKDVDMYIIVVASAQELPDVEELHQLEPDKIICFYNLKLDILRGDLGVSFVVVFNRLFFFFSFFFLFCPRCKSKLPNKTTIKTSYISFLTLIFPSSCYYLHSTSVPCLHHQAPAFPPKDFQDRFLSKVKPVYYLRTRQYSRSVANPPFVVNFQGCLFRSYPGQFQTLLDTGNGKYRRVVGSDTRPGLGEFKQQLTNALTGDGVIKEEGNFLNFLRTGYKTSTWWEEEREDADDGWRT